MTNPKTPLPLFDKIYETYHKDAGKMLRHTGTIAWILSSVAQLFGIAANDKIPKEQKMYMIPQEIADAVFNILSYYFVTLSFSKAAAHLAKTGKWIPKDLKNYLVKNGYKDKIGKLNFDISKVKLGHSQERSFDLFGNGLSLVATIIGTVISCNIITPIFRNCYAAKRQQSNLEKLHNPNPRYENPKTFRDRAGAALNRTYMQAFMNRDSLKI